VATGLLGSGLFLFLLSPLPHWPLGLPGRATQQTAKQKTESSKQQAATATSNKRRRKLLALSSVNFLVEAAKERLPGIKRNRL
jgi:hypothetical protein